MKKADNRSHSWWWDSHISPKNSKWLSENLSEMDSKVSAMLKIIEEDADSFAQRAEMYYRRRPELINLVEEFYRTYRALVERYNFLTKEIRQNIAPVLQAQLGISPESAQNSPIDLHSKRGIDGFDIVSPSYSHPGPSEFDDDTQSEVSAKSYKGQNDEEETSPLGSRINLESHSFAFRPLEFVQESPSIHRHADVDALMLQKDLQRLQDENKALTAKASEDVTNLKNLHLELSNLQVHMKSLEAEDKMTKKKLKSVLEQEQELEAENLKLSHALIQSREEKSELMELRKEDIENNKTAGYRILQLEEDAASLKKELLAAQLQVSVGLEHAKKCEEEVVKVQRALVNLLDEKERDCLSQEEPFEQLIQCLNEKFFFLKHENGRLKEQIVHGAAEVKRLEDQLTELSNTKEALEQVLVDLRKQLECLEAERLAAILKSQELEKELETSHKDIQSLSDENAQSNGHISKLEEMIKELLEKCSKLEFENIQGSTQLTKLGAYTEELQKVKDVLLAESEECKAKCKAVQMSKIELQDQVASLSNEKVYLQDQNEASEVMAASAQLQVQESQHRFSALEAEKMVLMQQLEDALQEMEEITSRHKELQLRAEAIQGERDRHKEDLLSHSVHIKELEETMVSLGQAKEVLERQDAEAQDLIMQLQEKNSQLGEELGAQFAVVKSLNERKLQLENEQAVMASELQEMQKKLVLLQDEKSSLTDKLTKSMTDHQSAMEAVRRTEEDLSCQLSKLWHLHEETDAKKGKLESEIKLIRKELDESEMANRLLALEREEISKMLVDAETKLHDLDLQLAKAAEANAELEKELLQKREHIEMLKVELFNVTQVKAGLEDEIASKADYACALQEKISILEGLEKTLTLDLERRMSWGQALEMEVQQLREAVCNAEDQNIILTREQQNMLHERLDLKRKIEYLQGEIDHLMEEKNLLIAEMAVHTCQAEEQKQNFKSVQADQEVLEAELESSLRLLRELKEEVKSLGEGKEHLSKKLADAEGGRVDLETSLLESQDKNSVLANDLSEKAVQIEALEVHILELQTERDFLGAKISTLAAEHDDLKQIIDILQTGKDGLEYRMESLHEQVSKLEEENNLLEEWKVLAAEKLVNADACIKDLEARLSESIEQNFLLANEKSERTAEIDTLRAQVLELEKVKVTLEKEIVMQSQNVGSLLMQIESDKEQENFLYTQLKDKSDAICRLKGEMEMVTLAASKAEAEKAALAHEQKRGLDETLFLQKRIEDLQEQLGHATEEKETLLTKMVILTESQKELFVKLEMLKFAVSKAEEERIFLVDEQKRNTDECLVLQNRIEDLQEQLDHVMQEKITLLGELATLFESKEELLNSFKDIENKKDLMEKELLQVDVSREQLKEELEKVLKERKQLAESLEAELQRRETEQEEMAKLQESLGSTLKEYEMAMDMVKVKSDEKSALEVQCANLRLELEENKNTILKAKNEVMKLKMDLDELQQLNKKLEDDLTSKLDKIEQLREELSRVESDKKKAEAQVTNLEEDNYLLEEGKVLAAEKLLDADACIKDLEAQLSEAIEQSFLLANEKSEKAAEIDTLRSQIMELEKAKVIVEKEIIMQSQNMASLLAQLESYKEQESSLHTQLTDKSDAIFRLEGEVEMMKLCASKAEVEKVALSHEQKRNLDEIFFLQNRIEDLQKQLAHAAEEKQTLSTTIIMLTESQKELLVELEVLKLAVASAEEERTVLVDEQKRNMDESSILQKRTEDLQEQLDLVMQEKLTVSGAMVRMTEAKEELVNNVKDLEGKEVAMHMELQQVGASLQHLKEEKRQLAENLDAERQKSQMREEDMVKLQESLRTSLKEHEAAMDMVKVKSDEKSELKVQCADLQVELEENKIAILKVKNEATKLEMHTGELQHLNKKLEDDLCFKVEEIAKLREELSILETEKKKVEEKMHMGEKQVEILGEEIAKVQESLRIIQQEYKTVIVLLKAKSEEKKSLFEVQFTGLHLQFDEEKAATSKAEEEGATLQMGVCQFQDLSKGLDVDLSSKPKEIEMLKEELSKMESSKEKVEEKRLLNERQTEVHGDEAWKLQELLSSFLNEYETAMEMLKVNNNEKSALELQYTNLQAELEEYKTLMLKAKEEAAKLKMELSQCQHASNVLEIDLNSKLGEITVLKEELLKVESTRKEVEEKWQMDKQQMRLLVHEIGKLHESLSSSLRQYGYAMDMLNIETDKNTECKVQYAEVETETDHNKIATSIAKGKSVELEMGLNQLQHASKALEVDLRSKFEEISLLKEKLLKVEFEKQRLEEKLQIEENQMELLGGEMKSLQQALALAWDNNKRLEELSRQSTAECISVQNALLDIKEELDKELLKNKHLQFEKEEEVDVLKQDLVQMQEEKTVMMVALVSAQKDLLSLQQRHESMVHECHMRAQEAEGTIVSLQQQLKNMELEKLVLAQTKCHDFALLEESLQQEVVQLKLEKTQHEEDLAIQRGIVGQLENKMRELQSDYVLLWDESARSANQLTVLQIELAELRDKENGHLCVSLGDSTAPKENLSVDVENLQTEQVNWKDKTALDAALIAELEAKMALLADEKAALAKELSVKAELGSKLQEEVNLLVVANTEATQKWQATVTDAFYLEGVLKTLMQEDMLALNFELTTLQAENSMMHTFHEREAIESCHLEKQVNDLADEVSDLRNKNEKLKRDLSSQSTFMHQWVPILDEIYMTILKYYGRDVGSSIEDKQGFACMKLWIEGREMEKRIAAEDISMQEHDYKNAEAEEMQDKLLEAAMVDGLNRLEMLRECFCKLLEENESLRNETLEAWTKYNFSLESSKEMEQEISHCLEENCHLAHVADTFQSETKVIKRRMAHLKAENVIERKKMQDNVAYFQEEGMKLLMILKEKLGAASKEIEELTDYVLKHFEEKVQHDIIQKPCEKGNADAVSLEKGAPTIQCQKEDVAEAANIDGLKLHAEMEIQTKSVLPQLCARIEDAKSLLQALIFFRTMMLKLLQDSQSEVEQCARIPEAFKYGTMKVGSAFFNKDRREKRRMFSDGSLQYHINLGTRLHQAYMDEQLELDLMELKKSRKQLKEDLEARVVEVQKMQEELRCLHKTLEEVNQVSNAGSGGDSSKSQHWLQKKKRVQAKIAKVQEELVDHRQQIGKMHAEYEAGSAQEQAIAESLEEQILLLVSKEVDPTMDGWDEEQVDRLSKEMGRMRTLNRQQSLELQTMSHKMLRVGSLIQSAQWQLLAEEQQEEDRDDNDEKLCVSDSFKASSTVSSSIMAPLQPFGGLRRSRSYRSLLGFLRSGQKRNDGSSALSTRTGEAVGCWTFARSSSRFPSFNKYQRTT